MSKYTRENMSTTTPTWNTGVVCAFNSFLGNLLKLSTKAAGPDLKALVKAKYRYVNLRDPQYAEFFHSSFDVNQLAATRTSDILAGAVPRELLQCAILDGVLLSDALATKGRDKDAEDDDDVMRLGVWRNVYALAVLSRLGPETKVERPDQLTALLDLMNRITEFAKSGIRGVPEDSESAIENAIAAVADPVAQRLMSGLFELYACDATMGDVGHQIIDESDVGGGVGIGEDGVGVEGSAAAESDPDAIGESIMAAFSDSKLGDFVKEIATDISANELSNIDPSKLSNDLNIADLLNPNSPLGGIMGKIGSKIMNKLQTGEFNVDDLRDETLKIANQIGPSLQPLAQSATHQARAPRNSRQQQGRGGGARRQPHEDMDAMMGMFSNLANLLTPPAQQQRQ